MSYSGISIKTFCNPLKAIDVFKKEKFHVVITDINMPEMNGFKVLETVHEIDSSTHVIMLTGIPDEYVESTAMKSGACAFLTKPLDLEKLMQAIAGIEKKKTARKKKLRNDS